MSLKEYKALSPSERVAAWECTPAGAKLTTI